MRIGLISDTHGLLRPEAVSFLRGSDRIVHAGDVGDPGILAELAGLAPLYVVRGNIDTEPWAGHLPETEMIEAGGISIYVLHDLSQLDIDPAAAGISVIVSGHSHKPVIERRKGIIFINPGSAGPRRFKLPISVGEVLIDGRSIKPRVVELA
jgi:putative phosphoesterase